MGTVDQNTSKEQNPAPQRLSTSQAALPTLGEPQRLSTSQAALPTLGATFGSALGAVLAAKVGGADPLIGNTIATLTTAVVTALFHWVGTKLGSIV
jgi:hypothetical protein